MSYGNYKKYNYQEGLTREADTVLYEQALTNIEQVEKNKSNPHESCHWKNAAIYQEFWRRNKQEYYTKAYNLVQIKMGYKKI